MFKSNNPKLNATSTIASIPTILGNNKSSVAPPQASSMDLDPEYVCFTPPSPTRPLRLRNENSQIQSMQIQKELSNNNPYRGQSRNQAPPPRSSSLRQSDSSDASGSIPYRMGSHLKEKSYSSSADTSKSLTKGEGYLSTGSIARQPSDTLAESTARVRKAKYLSDTSSGIIGNFVPVDYPNMDGPSRNNAPLDAYITVGSAAKPPNPYEFEPDSPYLPYSPQCNQAHQTTFRDFIEGRNFGAPNSPRSPHIWNLRSENNAVYVVPNTESNPPARMPVGHALKRSESSPNVIPSRFPGDRDGSESPDRQAYLYEGDPIVSPAPRGRSPRRVSPDLSYQNQRISPTGTSTNIYPRGPSHLRSPDRSTHQRTNVTSHSHTAYGRYANRSPPKTLDDVSEHYESSLKPLERSQNSSPPNSPKLRSRSPMKKMFGEHGWLGRSPDEADEAKLRAKKSTPSRKEKSSIMGKLKTKLEELAEKTDLSPSSKGTRQIDKHQIISVLAVSLGPPEQARISMEIELMLVHTANSFLMNQFSMGRIAVDSIKKTVDTWRSKGRPIVIEFMYDQATQRDLVAVNQQNFRFHGERAGDGVRINSMLYNWKQVAALMAIRTFCDADTVLLKLLFDTEQILELLGAREPILLRLQHIRCSANEMIRIARQDTDTKPLRETTWNSQSTAESSKGNHSTDNLHGGMKSFPDPYGA